MKKFIVVMMLAAILLTSAFAGAKRGQDMYLSQSFVLDGGYHLGGYSPEGMIGDGHPYVGIMPSFHFGGDISPSTPLYGIVGIDGSIDPSGEKVSVLDSTGGRSYEGPWYKTGVNLGFGASWRLEDSLWSLGLEGWADIDFSPSGLSFGGSLSFVPKRIFHIAREWFGWSLITPLTFSFSPEGIDASLGIGLSIELSDYLGGTL